MDATKQALLRKLLAEGKITQDEFYVLEREEIKEEDTLKVIPYPQMPTHPMLPQKRPFPYDQSQDWISQELDRRAKIAENCPCNPANGGSGMCGCVLASPVIYS